MIEIYPDLPSESGLCPRCKHENNSKKGLYFQGMHVLGNYTCDVCHLAYYAGLPSGHMTHFPVSFTSDGRYQFFDPVHAAWLANPLIDSMRAKQGIAGVFQIYNEIIAEELLLINCLDSCFGHVFTKVWNVYTEIERHPHRALAVLIPEQCKWLLPNSGVEIWSVDLPLKQFSDRLVGLDTWVRNQFRRFKKVLLHPSYIHLDHQQMDFEKILGVKPFDLEKFDQAVPQITFIWREDRFWLANRFLNGLYMFSKKFKLEKIFKPLFLWRQKTLIERLFKIVKNKLSKVNFTVTGLGKTITFQGHIKDERVTSINFEVEKGWNTIFSQSQVVIAVHGSHMLIPSALAAGFVEILPKHKMDHITEDICRIQPGRLSHFLGRIVDENSSPALVALHTSSMVQRFKFVKSNLESKLV